MDEQCSICLETLSCEKVTECKHRFCRICIEKWKMHNTTCPMCRSTIECKSHFIRIGTPTADELNEFFGWDVEHTIEPQKLFGYHLWITLDGRSNWIPQNWWDYARYRAENEPEVFEVLDILNRGAFGKIYYSSGYVVPPTADQFWICDFCENSPYVSNRFSVIDEHEKLTHPAQYVKPENYEELLRVFK